MNVPLIINIFVHMHAYRYSTKNSFYVKIREWNDFFPFKTPFNVIIFNNKFKNLQFKKFKCSSFLCKK